MKSFLLALALSGAAALPAAAADIAVRSPVIRVVAPGVANTAGYMTVVNSGARPDRLVSASCACSARVELHISHVMDGKAMMMPSGPVVIPAGGQVVFRPGANHLMVIGLKAPLKEGAMQEIALKFERAGEVKARFAAMSRIPTSPAPAGGHSGH